VTAADTHRTIEAVWRIESARLIAGLARIVRDVGRAEELAQDALVAALEQWPRSGIPDKPGAWLMATAKHRAIDLLRRDQLRERKHQEIGRDEVAAVAAKEEESLISALDDEVGDDLLRLVFTACHPVLSTDARVALTLRLLGGLTTEEIARAFLVPEPTIAQRIVRAKRTLAASQVPFEVPRGPDLVARLSSVLEVLYLIFNEGYSATAGADWMRPALCEDALRLGRILAELTPGEPEVHGLVALMEIQASRTAARTGPAGEPVVLLAQNRARWDRLLIGRGLAALARADSLGGAPGPTPCRRRSPPATRGRAPRRRPTGRASRRSTRPSPASPPHRSSSSTAPSPSPWRSGRRPGWRSSTGCSPSPRCGSITCCRACAPISSPGSAASPRPGPRTSAPRR
jgi:RNA polymerase sigma factor (sigma-70 family)